MTIGYGGELIRDHTRFCHGGLLTLHNRLLTQVEQWQSLLCGMVPAGSTIFDDPHL